MNPVVIPFTPQDFARINNIVFRRWDSAVCLVVDPKVGIRDPSVRIRALNWDARLPGGEAWIKIGGIQALQAIIVLISTASGHSFTYDEKESDEKEYGVWRCDTVS